MRERLFAEKGLTSDLSPPGSSSSKLRALIGFLGAAVPR